MKENFKKEVESLLSQLEERISNFSQELAIEDSNTDQEAASNMNLLKLHRYKMKELLLAMKAIDAETWRTKRETYKQMFEKAENTLTLTP